MPRIYVRAGKAALALEMLQFLLAIYLLMAGIVTLLTSPRGRKQRRRHRRGCGAH